MAIAKLQYIQAELIEQLIHMVKLIPRIKQASNPLTIRGNIQIIITSNNLFNLIENLQTICQIIIFMIPQTDHEHILFQSPQTSHQAAMFLTSCQPIMSRINKTSRQPIMSTINKTSRQPIMSRILKTSRQLIMIGIQRFLLTSKKEIILKTKIKKECHL